MLATTIIHTTIGTSKARMPGAREFMRVVMKLIPPRRKATNSRPDSDDPERAPERRQVVGLVGR